MTGLIAFGVVADTWPERLVRQLLAHHVNIAAKAICPELDEKRKCFLRARTLRRLRPPQQLRQLGDVGGDALRFVACQQVRRRSATGLILEVDVRQRLPVVILPDEAGGVRLLNGKQAGSSGRPELLGNALRSFRRALPVAVPDAEALLLHYCYSLTESLGVVSTL
jgi:hypothetical protein